MECRVQYAVGIISLLSIWNKDWPIKDWINFLTLYIGIVHFLFQVCQAIWWRYSYRKMVALLANSGDSDQMPHSVMSNMGLRCLPVTPLGVYGLQWVNLYHSLDKLYRWQIFLIFPWKKASKETDNLHESQNPIFWYNKIFQNVVYRIFYLTCCNDDEKWWFGVLRLSTLFKSFRDDDEVLMTNSVQWSAI